MTTFGRRMAVGWLLGWLVLVGAFAWAGATNPARPDAVGGEPHRAGLLTIALLLPALFAAWRLGRLADSHRTAPLALPLLLAVAIAVLMGAVGFIPDDFLHCATLADAEVALPPRCVTSGAARLRALGEAGALWALFGAAALSARRWVPREPATGHTAGMG